MAGMRVEQLEPRVGRRGGQPGAETKKGPSSLKRTLSYKGGVGQRSGISRLPCFQPPSGCHIEEALKGDEKGSRKFS